MNIVYTAHTLNIEIRPWVTWSLTRGQKQWKITKTVIRKSGRGPLRAIFKNFGLETFWGCEVLRRWIEEPALNSQNLQTKQLETGYHQFKFYICQTEEILKKKLRLPLWRIEENKVFPAVIPPLVKYLQTSNCKRKGVKTQWSCTWFTVSLFKKMKGTWQIASEAYVSEWRRGIQLTRSSIEEVEKILWSTWTQDNNFLFLFQNFDTVF